MDDLIARLEVASEGSTELSAEIARDIFGIEFHKWPFWTKATSYDGIPGSAVVPVTPYTTSLDAALTLVPEGWKWRLDGVGSPRYYEADLWGSSILPERKQEYISSGGSTPALALCSAALRARTAP